MVVLWLRIHLVMHGSLLQFLVWEDTTYCGATKPEGHNYWSLNPESLCTEIREATAMGSLQAATEEQSLLLQLEKALM